MQLNENKRKKHDVTVHVFFPRLCYFYYELFKKQQVILVKIKNRPMTMDFS